VIDVSSKTIAHALNFIRLFAGKPIQRAFTCPHKTPVIRADRVSIEFVRPGLQVQGGRLPIADAGNPAAAVGQPDIALCIRRNGGADILRQAGTSVE
jgi:hypothetical protein